MASVASLATGAFFVSRQLPWQLRDRVAKVCTGSVNVALRGEEVGVPGQLAHRFEVGAAAHQRRQEVVTQGSVIIEGKDWPRQDTQRSAVARQSSKLRSRGRRRPCDGAFFAPVSDAVIPRESSHRQCRGLCCAQTSSPPRQLGRDSEKLRLEGQRLYRQPHHWVRAGGSEVCYSKERL